MCFRNRQHWRMPTLAISACRAAVQQRCRQSRQQRSSNPHLLDASGDLEDAVLRLRAIRGIGEWTAQYIALRQLREPDAFPAADVGLLRAMSQLEGREYTAVELSDRANTWQPWRAYAAQHLWAVTPPG